MDEALDSMVEGADKQGAPKRLSTLPADADSKYEVDVNKLCTELASNEVEDDCDIVHENFLMAIYFIGKTGAGMYAFQTEKMGFNNTKEILCSRFA